MRRMPWAPLWALFALCALLPQYAAASANGDAQEHAGDFIAHDFRFESGTSLAQVKLHYVTLGTLRRDARGHAMNAVLLLHGTTGTSRAYLAPAMRAQLFAPGEPLDASRYFIIIPDGLGRGGSTKPSDGMRARFPAYGYNDVVSGQYRLVTEGLHVDHLRLVLGTSMGGMQTWMWGERYPGMMDALMPIASQPIAMAGRNWFWRQMIIAAIRHDPGWQGGDYAQEPTQWLRAMPIFKLITSNPARMQAAAPDRESATRLYDAALKSASHYDANDALYWFESSKDYNPEPDLGAIKARLYAVNFADDLINAADLGVMQRLMPRVAHGRFVEIPEGPHSYGHETLAHPEVWKPYLVELLNSAPALH